MSQPFSISPAAKCIRPKGRPVLQQTRYHKLPKKGGFPCLPWVLVAARKEDRGSSSSAIWFLEGKCWESMHLPGRVKVEVSPVSKGDGACGGSPCYVGPSKSCA